MPQYSRHLALSLIATLGLAACSTPQGEFPSLSKRPYEKADPVEEPPVDSQPLSTRLPDSLAEQTNALLARSGASAAAFARALPAAQSAARGAAGSAKGSEPWVQAHVILSRLDASRSDGVAALAAIDQLVTGERETGADAGIMRLLVAIQSEIAGDVSAQNAQIGALHRLIG
jgi:hypothetical protein